MQTLCRRIAILLVVCGCAAAAYADLKITTQNTMQGQSAQGQSTQGTTYIKGSRQRSETQMMGIHTVTITQCDRRQTITVSDACRTYMVAPMMEDTGDNSGNQYQSEPSGTTRQGGTITINSSSNNTGETRQMFGYTARHIKSHMSMSSSPDACNPNNMEMDSDGWYADFSAQGLSCTSQPRPNMGRGARPDCQDRVRFTGSGMRSHGYPMKVSTTIHNEGRDFTMTQETLELSRANLDPALFEAPAGYRRVDSYRDMMCQAAVSGGAYNPPPSESPRQQDQSELSRHRRGSGTGALCVAPIQNRTSQSLDNEAWRDTLLDELQRMNVQSVKLESTTQFDLRAEAYDRGCGHILYTDVNDLRAPSNARRYGHAAGAGNAANYNDTVHVYLMPTNDFTPWLDTDVNGTGRDMDAAEQNALRSEAGQVATELSRPR
jgi:hypothetical protein